ncbi:MAG: TRAP transporter small permease subunit [Alphaproteobacteria bacterium]|nr:TRAP transporter small permease subunit [Alphaproteobacteria bacterium]
MMMAFHTLSDVLDRVCRAVAGCALIVLLLVVLIQLVARYVLDSPPVWTEELARYAMIWAGLLGATVAFKVASDPVIANIFPEKLSRAIQTIAVLVFLLPIIAVSRGFLGRAAELSSEVLGISMIFVVAAVPVAAMVILIHLMARLATRP